MQIFVAERTHSQWIQLLLGKYTTFVLGSFALFFVVVYQVFLFCFIFVYIFPFYLEGMGRTGNKEVGAAFSLFFKLNYKGCIFFKCVMRKVVYEKKKNELKFIFSYMGYGPRCKLCSIYLPNNAHLRNVCRSEIPLSPGTKLHWITPLQLAAA